jgi:zinc/manganese transport system substrate-binding protein
MSPIKCAVSMLLAACLGVLCAAPAGAASAPAVQVVAAENFYGDMARQIGGERVAVTSILQNPDDDPHLFEASPATARALAHAQVVIYNGLQYDPWMDRLLHSVRAARRTDIAAAAVVGAKPGGNPHLWYAPQTMPAVARATTLALAAADPAHRADFEAGLARFNDAMRPLQAKVSAMRERFHGMPVTAVEPVFGLMADALGLDMRNQRLQLAVMNDTEPSASDIAAFEADLGQRRVRALLYNSQTSDQLTRRLRALAQRSGVPVVGVSETQPAGMSYQQWMLAQLDALEQALTGQRP